MTHDRFIFSFETLSKTLIRNRYFQLQKNILDQYATNKNDLMNTMLLLINSESEMFIDFQNKVFKSVNYMHSFEKMLQQSVFDITRTITFRRNINQIKFSQQSKKSFL